MFWSSTFISSIVGGALLIAVTNFRTKNQLFDWNINKIIKEIYIWS